MTARLFLLVLLSGGLLSPAFPATAPGAEISGRIAAAGDSTALPGASVHLKKSGLGVLTGKGGRFRFAVQAGQEFLVVSFVGFRTLTVPVEVGEAESLDLGVLFLDESAVELPGVVVTATRRPQLFSEAPISMSVTDKRELTGFNSFSLSGPLRHLPGVSQVGSQVSIRGSSGYSRGTGSRVLLLLDGVPALSADQADIKWDTIPVTEVERVELIKGAGSALYGTGALGGVINVLTRSPSELPETRFRLVSGLYDQPAHPSWEWRDLMYLGGVDVSHSRTTAAGGYLVSAGHKRRTGYRENNESIRYNLFAKGTRQLGRRTRWTGLASWAHDDYGVFLQWKDRATPLLVPEGDRGAATVSWKLNLNSEVTHLVNPGTNLTWRGFYFRTDFDNTRAAGGLASAGHKIGTEMQVDLGERLGTGGVIVGATGIYDLARSPADFLGQRTVLNTAAYAQNVVAFRDLEVTLGVRADLHRRDAGEAAPAGGPCGSAAGGHGIAAHTEAQFSPQLGLSWIAAPGAIRLSAGRGFRAPSVTEIHVQADASGILVCPNPDLGSESSWSYEAGIRRVLGGTLSVDAALFWNEFEGLIEARPDPTSTVVPRASFRNISRARIRGLELEQQLALPLGALWKASYTYVDAEEFLAEGVPLPPYCHDDLAPGQTAPLPYRSRHAVTTNLGLARGMTRGGLTFRYTSRFERVSGLFAECGRDHLPVYLVDAFVERRIGPATLTLRADNLLRYHYILSEREIRPMRRVTLALSGAL